MTQIEEEMNGLVQNMEYLQANNIYLQEVRPDHATLYMKVDKKVKNVYGVVHGGAIFVLADTAAGFTACTDGRHCVTQNSNFHFIGNADHGRIWAEGKVVHRGRVITVVHVTVTGENGELIGDGVFDMYRVDRPYLESISDS